MNNEQRDVNGEQARLTNKGQRDVNGEQACLTNKGQRDVNGEQACLTRNARRCARRDRRMEEGRVVTRDEEQMMAQGTAEPGEIEAAVDDVTPIARHHGERLSRLIGRITAWPDVFEALLL